MSFLALEENKLSGSVPSTLGNIAALETLGLQNNNLEGNMDFLSALSNCRNLQLISIDDNSFTSSLPDSMGNLTSLNYNVQGLHHFAKSYIYVEPNSCSK